ncbi:MAG: methyltransferase domain-containing protein [Spirochaetota bacterium]|nr:methyltransferase domain-containing protein [Spirochaetota bacterium]
MRQLLGSLLWDFYSLTYDLFTKSILKDVRKDYISDVLKLSPSEKVIDNLLIIGVGTGEDLTYIDSNISVTAIDYSISMLKKAQRKIKLKHNIKFIQMDAQNLDFPDYSFQRILMPLIITVSQNPFQCLKEAERVLKIGGRIVIFDKFLHKNHLPSLFRRFVNCIINALATNINIDFYKLLIGSKLKIIEEKKSIFKGLFKIFILEKS